MPEWVPIGWHFRALSGTDPFVIDQTVTVTFEGKPSRGSRSCWPPSARPWPPTAAPPGSSATTLPCR